MKRRQFILKAGLAAGGLLTLPSCISSRAGARAIRWTRSGSVFTSVACDGQPLVASPSLLTAKCHLEGEATSQGPLRVSLEHQLRDSGSGFGEDTLEAVLTIHNPSDRSLRVHLEFATAANPSPRLAEQRVYVPLSAAGLGGDKRFAALGVKEFLKDCNQAVGASDFAAHYLEPMASQPTEKETRALLLAPVLDVFEPQRPWRVALFTPSDQPMRFSHRSGVWRVGRQITVAAGGAFKQRCWLMIHRGDASVAWKAFHRFAHREDHPPIGWTREFKVHYYDFLSSADGKNGRRGDGYERDLPNFREFRVGMATQHGYYPSLGDYIHPDRKTWQAMRGDKQGPAEMSFEKMRARIRATRAAGAKAAIYLHPVLFDDATPFFNRMRDSVLVDDQGQMVRFPWSGPDTVDKNWRASIASPQWREHLLQQAEWIMDILKPDAICVDETFAGLGYDYHPDHAGPMSLPAIDWHRKLRALVRSHGSDKAVFTSDCSDSSFVFWADGEVGDHAYPTLLGHPLYTQEPVRYLAALGDKPWRPCAWHFQKMWKLQMALACQVGAGVGVSNGWLEYTGLADLPASLRAAMLADITTLFDKP